MLHKDVMTISYKHNYEIKKVCADILGMHGIEHFSLDLVRPDSEMIFFSGTPSHGYEICKRGYAPYDGIISPDYYQNFEFYWWDDAYHKAFAKDIKAIREGLLGLKHGFMLVRKWNNFHLVYSFATKTDNSEMRSFIVNNINEYLKMGDYAYNNMRELYSEYCGEHEPPSVEQFFKFEGGAPPPRFTRNYRSQESGLLLPDKKNIINVDFQKRKKL